ncbi:hypothetical protein CAOG_07857 [Capsaspora owczarzaki ATCC 30864]|uniref:SGNH hydrolase-type esterase domain-containing protein n=1 Tax=Capsaspora owczarzaki (strain ATCC 30864) TaxID=595528 RepID=A0A0D2X5G2_CAPO3|nr:hypothetical protein CAOG_07857 [Capsaspora owczarzaki ATCC 30864]KJE97754.1 hypothetical protein CAOG_007857 [Capsaspora owczarzaki ATCC 30864]|eukprot:XP_004342942.1 hypothetical protein CAOG_07857 [Capsaspora owczarzaki ATCC 30864]
MATTTTTTAKVNYRYGRILLLGDSITQLSAVEGAAASWSALISSHFQRRADVLRRGYSGYNTSWVRAGLVQMLEANGAKLRASQPTASELDNPDTWPFDAVVIFMGANDARFNLPQHVDVDQYGANLTEFVRVFHDQLGVPLRQIVIVTPPAVANDKYEAYTMQTYNEHRARSNEVTHKYAVEALRVASSLGTRSLNLWQAMNDQIEVLPERLRDGLHFSESGAAFFATLLIPVLDECLAHIQTVLPEWRNIDFDNIPGTFPPRT